MKNMKNIENSSFDLEEIDSSTFLPNIDSNIKCMVLGIEYDGSLFHGWQIQPDRITIQKVLQDALAQFLNHPVNLQSAGRTDRGVHAINQIAHLYTPVERDEHSWVRATNTLLRQKGYFGVRILWAKYVPNHFHSRFLAHQREYVYYVYADEIPPACFSQYLGHVFTRQALNIEEMQQAILHLVGEHDFSSFRSSECQALSAIKHLKSIRIEDKQPYYAFYFQANAFLHHMVRNLMGLLLAVGTGKKSATDAKVILDAKNRQFAPPTFMPNGLFFRKITYDTAWGLNFEVRHSIEKLLNFSARDDA
jgi:tRNA pseudouridine38-40 synthase